MEQGSMPDLSIKIKDLTFKNPVITASGTYGYGLEFLDYYDVNQLGGITLKGLSLHPKKGNPVPRIAETPSGGRPKRSQSRAESG